MVREKSFEKVILELKERKQFERESKEAWDNKECKACGNKFGRIPMSGRVDGYCKICVELNKLTPTEPER